MGLDEETRFGEETRTDGATGRDGPRGDEKSVTFLVTAADETTRRIAARLGARRVEIRGAAGVVGVRYLRRP